MGNVYRLQRHLFPLLDTHTIQEVPTFSCPRSFLSKPYRSGIQGSGEGGQPDKNPSVPKQLVGQSLIPPNLSLAYTDSSSLESGTRLDSENRKIRTGAQTDLRLRRLPVQPQ